MQAQVTITPAQLPDMLLRLAVVRAVHIWGPPGIGKSSMVRQFADSVGLPCMTLLGSQLAPEDLIGVPQIITRDDGTSRSRFAPPEMIARDEPYVLFLDELNGASSDVQRACYSLVLDRRLGEYELPKGSIVIAAGNRATDQAIVRPMSSALVNRFYHIHLGVNADDWLAWAHNENLNPLVLDYINARRDHLWVEPPKVEQSYSTPRSWHALSDALTSWGDDINDEQLRVLAHSSVSPTHAESFVAYVRSTRRNFQIDAIIKGTQGWPTDPADRDILHFLTLALRARLSKQLPATRDGASSNQLQLAHRSKALLTELADVNLELAQLVVAGDIEGNAALPSWFLIETLRDLPRLAAARSGN